MKPEVIEKVSAVILESNIEEMFIKLTGAEMSPNICRLTLNNLILSFGAYISNCYIYDMKININTIICFFIMDFTNKFEYIKNTNGLVEFAFLLKTELAMNGIEVS